MSSLEKYIEEVKEKTKNFSDIEKIKICLSRFRKKIFI